MVIIDYGHEFRVRLEHNSFFKRNLTAIKNLPGVMYDWKDKSWKIPPSAATEVAKLKITHSAVISKPEIQLPEHIGEYGELKDLVIDVPLNNVTLRPYQRQGVARGMELKRFMNGDDMGLGKTLQSIATMVGWSSFPFLVICPASLKENWKREIEKFSTLRAMVLSDKVKSTWYRYAELGYVDVFIVNYESLKKYFVKSMPTNNVKYQSKHIEMFDTINLFKGVIIDEAHKCKSTTTIQTKLALRIAHKKEYRILLTGTPVVNKPSDLYPLLAIMGQTENFGGKLVNFKKRYMSDGTSSNMRELNYLLNEHCYFRREKTQVLKDLPGKERQTIICDIDKKHRDEYVRVEADFVRYLKEFKNCSESEVERKLRGEIMVKLGILRGISARGKIHAAKEFIDEVMESGNKLIVFCNLKEIVHELKLLYPNAGTVIGDDSLDQRYKNIDSFQSKDGINLIICNIKAAGTGITLTAASRVLFIEFPWTYADCVQCEDRSYRMGQNEYVMCTYLLGNNTVDEKIYRLIQEKKVMANTISGAVDHTKENIINQLTNLFNIK